MRLKLANECNREMYYFKKSTLEIWPVFAVAESRSGDTIDTNYGERLRTSSKNHAIFNSYDFALLARKEAKNEFDDEHAEILKRLKLRKNR
jgi:hypothetical protein